jgi:hypothetical protein
MRKLLAAMLMLVGLGLVSLGGSKDLTAMAQTGGVYWIVNHRFDISPGRSIGTDGIYQLTTGGTLSLLIPASKIAKLNTDPANRVPDLSEMFVSDIALDAQGKIFLLHYQGERGEQILQATAAGEVSVAVELPGGMCPDHMIIDSQGNFIIAGSCDGGPRPRISRVNPDGRTKLVALLAPTCPDAILNSGITIDQNGDYVVVLNLGACHPDQLLRIKPSGETSVIAEGDPRLGIFAVTIDPTGQGYYGFSFTWPYSLKIIHISLTGAVAEMAEIPLQGIKGSLRSFTVGPTGDLIVGTFCYSGPPTKDCPAGIYQIARDGSRTQVLYEGDQLQFPLAIQWIAK